jgi:hypothetical protein
MNMKPVQRTLANDTLYRRIDEMPISVIDRESAKAQLRAAERIADGFCDLVAALRSGAATIARHVRAVWAASPQH